ncbi:unnamed protein product, partial [marine sediment metagenome]
MAGRSTKALRKAYADASGDAKLIYAHILAVLRDPTGLPTLIAEIERSAWDRGWVSGSRTMSRLDRLIIAAGEPGDRRALPVIVAKMRQLD